MTRGKIPNAESQMPKEIRSPKLETADLRGALDLHRFHEPICAAIPRHPFSEFGIRSSFGFRHSVFGFTPGYVLTRGRCRGTKSHSGNHLSRVRLRLPPGFNCASLPTLWTSQFRQAPLRLQWLRHRHRRPLFPRRQSSSLRAHRPRASAAVDGWSLPSSCSFCSA